MAELPARLVELWVQGGFVMPWLVGSAFVLWFALGERWLSLRRSVVTTAKQRVAKLETRTSGRVREALADLYEELQRHRVLIQSVAATAPLVGLLGTVTGMIETFDALTTMSLYRGSGGIAGGISEALVSTQMGLAVAIPGLLAGRLLDRRQAALEAELDQLGGG
jgi:biopolymer transport protein ExbB